MNPNLDLLRAIAVLLVFIGHIAGFYGFMPMRPVNIAVLGEIGVQIFFVHTSLVLMESLERQQKESPNLYIPFMIRRCFRIYPLALLCIVTVLLFHLPMGLMSNGHFSGYKPDAQDIIANLSLLPDLSWRTPVLGPAWSLSIELQMYVLLPVLFLTIRSWRDAALAWIGAVAVCYMIQLRFQNIGLVNFAPCFFAGILAYRMHKRSILAGKCWPAFMAVMVLAACLVPGPTTDQERWLFTVALAMAIPLFAPISNPALIAASKAIAKYSYGIYLTHFFALWVTFEKLFHWPFAAKLVAYLALTAAFSYVLYHSVEAPMIECGKCMARLYAAEANSNCAVARELSVG